MHVQSQAQVFDPAHPADSTFVENVMWEQSGVRFVTANVPGGSNNDADIWFGAPQASQRQLDEVVQRTGADIRWLQTAFTAARANGDKAVVIIEQADMWDLDGKAPSHLSGYSPIVNEISRQTLQFGKPVLLINGDSHEYLSDNPLVNPALNTYGGVNTVYGLTTPVPNFHRLVVHGSTLPFEYLRLSINPAVDNGPGNGASATSFGPFSWERVVPSP